MLARQKSFFVTLTSNTSTDLYPQNTLSRFTTKLPISLDFKNNNYDEWAVGIVKFSCTKIEAKTKQSSVPRILFTNAEKENAERTIVPILLSDKINYEFEIVDILRQYPVLFDLIIKEDFLERYRTGDVNLLTPSLATNTVPVLVGSHHCKVLINKEYTLRNLFDVLLFQIPKDERINVVESLKKSITQKPTKSFDVKTKVIIKRLVKVILPEAVDPSEENGIPNYMCIYCDVVQPQMFGNVMARGMVMHPVKYQNQYDSYQYCDIVNIQYLPLEKSRITDISILIADENGEQINFKNDSFSTMVVLHFRKGI